MTPAAQRLAIAGALGLEVLGGGELSATGILMVREKGVTDWNVQQDWLSDLNAMHQIEECLDCHDSIEFARQLDLTRSRKNTVSLAPFYLVHATAAQRAEGWLKTKGLWQ